MKCPVCGDQAISFSKWCRGTHSLKTHCRTCGADLKGDYKVYIGLILTIVTTIALIPYVDTLWQWIGIEADGKRWRIIVLMPIIFLFAYLTWRVGSYVSKEAKPYDFYTTLGETADRFPARCDRRFLDVLIALDTLQPISDTEVIDTFFAFAKEQQSNADSMAQGLLSATALVCSKRPHLAPLLFSEPLQCLYYLGIDSLEGIKTYIRAYITLETPYMGRPPKQAYTWLEGFIARNDAAIIEAFRVMYDSEEEAYQDDIPQILRR